MVLSFMIWPHHLDLKVYQIDAIKDKQDTNKNKAYGLTAFGKVCKCGKFITG